MISSHLQGTMHRNAIWISSLSTLQPSSLVRQSLPKQFQATAIKSRTSNSS